MWKALGSIPSVSTLRPRDAQPFLGATTRATPRAQAERAGARDVAGATPGPWSRAETEFPHPAMPMRAGGGSANFDCETRMSLHGGIGHEIAVVREGLPRLVSQIKKIHH